MPDPNLFHLDWERTFEALTLVIILSFAVERFLALFFENRIYIERIDRPGLKEMIALAVSIAVCAIWRFDLLSVLILVEESRVLGYVITGGIIAGGSKASIKLFHDILNIKTSSYDTRHDLQAGYEARATMENLAKAKDLDVQSAAGQSNLVSINRAMQRSLERASRAAEASASQAGSTAVTQIKNALDEVQQLRQEKN